MIWPATELLEDLDDMGLVKAPHPPDDVPQVAEDTVGELGGSTNSMERKLQWWRMSRGAGFLLVTEADRWVGPDSNWSL